MNPHYKIRIYLFHRVSPERDPLWNPMQPALFERIVSTLARETEIVSLEKTLLGEFTPSGKKPLSAITFDDGYRDFMEYALPVLHKHKACASMYIVTDCVTEGLPPWTYIINHLFIHTSHLSIELNSKALPPSLQRTKWKNQRERLGYARRLSPFMKQLNNQERELIFRQVMEEFNDVDLPYGLMMNWNDVREVSAEGCVIGSHSCSHPLLTKKIDKQKLEHEIVVSGRKIEQETGRFPVSYCYPFGNYNKQIEQLTAEAGYKMGIAVNNKFYDSRVDNIFEIPRTELYDEPFLKARLRLSGALPSLNRMLRAH